MQRGVLAILLALASATPAYAQERITPLPAIGNDIAEIVRASDQMAEGSVTGGGRWLRISYASEAPFTGFVVPMRSATQYNPVDMVRFSLPAGEDVTVDVDLSVSPSWDARTKDYMVMFSAAEGAAPEITAIGIVPATAGDTVSAFVRHASAREAFVVSTYHMLRGYRILGAGVVPVLAVVIVLCAAGIIVWKRKAAAFPLLGLAFIAQIAYGARIDLDLGRLTAGHLRSWYGEGEYGEAGDIYALANAVRAIPDTPPLFVCFDSTDYFAKLLRYLLPTGQVHMTTENAAAPALVAVVRKIEWSYDDGRLKCGSIDAPARLLQKFSDGSQLFQL